MLTSVDTSKLIGYELDRLTFEELFSGGRTVDLLSRRAWAPAAVDSLVLACLHRIAHHGDSGCLLWLYDIHLILSNLTPGEADEFTHRAELKGLRAVCRSGVEGAAARFATSGADQVIERLSQPSSEGEEPTSAFLTKRQLRRDILLSDFRNLAGFRNRLKLAREHLFPPAQFMLQSYAVRRHSLLPFLYCHRAARGAWRILRGAE